MRTFLAVFLVVFATATASFADSPTVGAAHTDSPPKIDGALDSEEWQNAGVIENFTQVLPAEGDAPSEKTQVKILFDTDNLYIGIQCFDKEPHAVIAQQMQKEGDISLDDVMQIVINPFADNRNGYYFALTAGGGKLDGLVDSTSGELNTDWDGIWLGKAQINNEGWTAEFAIPLKTISFRGGAKEWGLNFERVIRRKQEINRWSGASVNQDFLDFLQAGKLLGLTGVKQGMGLTVKPYSSIVVDTEDANTTLRPGFDLAYKLTPSTTAQITVNTDFAEAEADQVLVNLTRFPLFFPEKRAFFLQDASVFSFGGITTTPLAFYSRRIGIVDGQKKDILAGIKVTGREDILNFGVLDVQMYNDPDLGGKNLGALRVAANIFDQSTAGVIVTHGDPETTGDNTLVGGDFNFRSYELIKDRVAEVHAWIMGSFSREGPANPNVFSGTNANDLAVGGKLSYPNDDISLTLYGARYGKDFNPALGFIERPGTWEVYGFGQYRFRTEGFFRRIDLRSQEELFLNLDGSLQTSTAFLPAIEIEDEYGDILYMHHRYVRDVLDQPFGISDGVEIPAGKYGFNQFNVALTLSSNRSIAPNGSFMIGSFYGGRIMDSIGGIDWTPSKHFLFSASYQHIDVSLPQGAFIVRLIIGRANINFTPEISWNTLLQYDSVSKNAGINSRFRYEIAPGQEFFLVVNQGINIAEEGFQLRAVNGSLTAKLGMTFNF